MRPFLIPELKVVFQAFMKLSAVFILVQENMFILNIPPESLYKNVVKCSATAVHADSYFAVKQYFGELRGSKLASLICVENLRLDART